LLPTYNRANDLEFAIFCILRQDFTDFELIVCDNCSTDNTKDIVKKFHDRRVRYIRNAKNIGVRLSIVKLIKLAKGRYNFLISDDDYIVYKDTLSKTFRVIEKYKVGYIRVNYLTRDPSKKNIFGFHGDKVFRHDSLLQKAASDQKTLDFIYRCDSSLISGNVFKNNFPDSVRILDSEVTMWIAIIFYCAQKYGAYFISRPQIIASWSEWSVNKNKTNPLFNLKNGNLPSKNFLDFVSQKSGKKNSSLFLRKELIRFYIKMFPAVRYYTGLENLRELSRKVIEADSYFSKNTHFWFYLILSYITPWVILKLVKNISFHLITNQEKTPTILKMKKDLKSLENEYGHLAINFKNR